MSSRAFGHGGFTGTAIWIDPELELTVLFLSNRVHPDGKGSVNRLAGRIGTIAAAAVRGVSNVHAAAAGEVPAAPAANGVLTGIDVLQRDEFAVLEGQRVGLITNHTGQDRLGNRTIDLLHQAENVTLVKLFSPEHGLAGKLDQRNIADGRDESTGLPIYSLYGESRRPSAESLGDLDTLVFDIQDIGTRFYTYISTMGLAMRAASAEGRRFVVLDRPNPINGRDVAGPVLDAGTESFVGFHTIPIRHGMTIGELAEMFRSEWNLNLDLQIVDCENWERDEYWDATGLTWINPSPNMRSLTQALLYPGIGILETTNLSVGRGTDTPFEWIGAPWIQPQELATALNDAELPGFRCVPVRFTPTASKFQGQACGGVQFIVTDRNAFRPVRTGLEIARQLRRLYPDAWEMRSFHRLLCDEFTHHCIANGESVDHIEAETAAELEAFRHRRAQFLRYR